ncbi:unnamed protein product [Rotaria magnacalcarata]|uniref:Uncharacterized protein n=4 Tax=Rotaria magnacalcarata TaxID=392030 RepID=A0A816H4P7_9BILA|nr:unnamed protein product [Rotaria magnacalcarata]CAF1683639.1 unnamed protein product [Rotaria magnacalcarata]CAF2118144.1 unnamed protein product [Rotaria magnacalcarata]CAF2244348.1 unnamed protein product [Rotaria magnacalcarata]CAF3977444.1 unnamed protein product [Rotaria magnacalcarata]
MKDSFSSPIPMLRDDTNYSPQQKTTDYRLMSNPFDPPTSVHLKQRLASFSIFNDQQENSSVVDVLSIERRAQVYPYPLSEHIVQIDTSLFNQEMRDRYQRASDDFCQTQLDLPTPITTNEIPIPKAKNQSWSNSSSTTSSSLLDQTRTIRHMGCQTRLSLPPAADLDSLIQSFASNSDQDDPPVAISNSSLNVSQIRRKLFSDEDDLLDETPQILPPRRSSSFDPAQRSSSPSQQQNRENYLYRHKKPITPDCSPIPLKNTTNSTKSSQQDFFAFTPESEPVVMTSVSRPVRHLSHISSPITNMSIGSPFIHPPQMPSDYARQVLDNALADLMECSM